MDLQIGVSALPEPGSPLDLALVRCGFVPATGARPDSPGVHRDSIHDQDLAADEMYPSPY